MNTNQKVLLCILDGWGVRHANENNGIALAKTPHWDHLWATYPHTTLEASELYVGLPHGQMGNSEVGHMTMGSGRVIMQELPRIDQAIEKELIPELPVMKQFVDQVTNARGRVHLLGLMSPGGVHAHQNHLLYFAKYLASLSLAVYIHAFMDGRDTPPQSGAAYLKEFLEEISSYSSIHLATIGGRYFAMDRDKRWDRVDVAYQAMVAGQGPQFHDALELMAAHYAQGIGDEFIPPHVMQGYDGMADGDGLIMVNFRADRARQILTSLLDPTFNHFSRSKVVQFSATIGMTEYASSLTPYMPILFEKQSLASTLGEVVAEKGVKQLRAAETEKYAHVTFFFNGGREEVFSGEDRILIESPNVATYDLQPEMSAPELTSKLVQAIQTGGYGLVIANYANPDMVGHTGIQSAIMKAVEAVDQSIGQLYQACKDNGFIMIITADHGNVEQMIDDDGQPHTAHTLNPVPFLVLSENIAFGTEEKKSLADIAPTILDLLGLSVPAEMTGKSLIFNDHQQRVVHEN